MPFCALRSHQMMKFSFHSLPLAVLVTLLLPIVPPSSCQTEESYVGHHCSNKSFTSNSTYQANLHSLVSSLSSQKGASNGFYRFSNGENSEDPINVYALCRGDLSESACRNCVNFSTHDLLQRCPTQVWGVAWYDNCMLRYSTSHNFSYRTGFYIYVSEGLQAPVSPYSLRAYFDTRNDLLSTLAERASLGDSTRKFATGNINFTASDNIYGLMQCIPDLNEAQCAQCLNDATEIPNPLLSQRWRILATACNLRVSPVQFYDTTSNAPGPDLLLPEPRKDVIVPKDKSHQYIVVIIVMSVCCILLIAGICIFICLTRRKEKLQRSGLQAIRVDRDEQGQARRGARSSANSVTPIMEMPSLETGVSSDNNTQDGTSISWILKTPVSNPAPR